MHPSGWDLCDIHETTFPMGEPCPKCSQSDAAAKPLGLTTEDQLERALDTCDVKA